MTKSAEAFRTISEVAEWLGVQTHVLRFWESKFSQVKPVKRAGGRRYYRPSDMLLLGGIRKLLHDDGMTIKGVQKILREEGMAYVADMSGPLDVDVAPQIDSSLTGGGTAPEADLAPVAPLTPQETAAPVQDPLPEPDMLEAMPEAPALPGFDAADMQDAPPLDEELAYPEAQLNDLPDTDTDPAIEGGKALMAGDPDPTAMDGVVEDRAALPPDPVLPGSPEFAARETAVQEPASMDAATEETAAPPLEPVAPDGPADDANADMMPETEQTALNETVGMVPDQDASASVEDALAAAPLPPTDAAPKDEVPTAPATPRPRIVDVPPDPDPDTIEVQPSALGMLQHLDRLTPAQISALRPLVAQLTALRDQMMQARRDNR